MRLLAQRILDRFLYGRDTGGTAEDVYKRQHLALLDPARIIDDMRLFVHQIDAGLFDPRRVKQSEMFAAIAKGGFQAEVIREQQAPKEEKESNRGMILMLVLGALLLYIGMSHMLPVPLPLPDIIHYATHPLNFALIQLILTTVILFLSLIHI